MNGLKLSHSTLPSSAVALLLLTDGTSSPGMTVDLIVVESSGNGEGSKFLVAPTLLLLGLIVAGRS